MFVNVCLMECFDDLYFGGIFLLTIEKYSQIPLDRQIKQRQTPIDGLKTAPVASPMVVVLRRQVG